MMFKGYAEITKNKDNLFPVMPVTIGVNHKQGYISRPKGLGVHQFVWVFDGKMEVNIPGETRVLTKGQCVFLHKNTPHNYKNTEGELINNWVVFSGGDEILKAFNLGEYLFFDMPDYANRSVLQLVELCKSTNSVALRAAHTNLWITEILCALQGNNQTLAEQVYTVLERDFGKNCRIGAL